MTAVPAGGRQRKQLRSAFQTVRKRRPSPRNRDGDAELLALLEEPYSGVRESHRRLRELLSAFKAREDRRAVFLEIYAEMTGGVAERIHAGEFADPDWVGDYLVEFANLYREAVRDYELGNLASLPDPWQLTFEAAEGNESLVLQDALLGVNAHINYDLALAVNNAGIRPNRKLKYEDHSRVTEVIADIMDDAQELLVEYGANGLETVDESLGRLDEHFMVLTIDECRDSAWRTATALNSQFKTRRRLARWINDITSTGAAFLLLSTKSVERFHETLVDLEDG